MPKTILYAKKLILPSGNANVVQSLNMASAFHRLTGRVLFYPGIKTDFSALLPGSKSSAQIRGELSRYMDMYGLPEDSGKNWHPLPVFHKGVFSVIFDRKISRAYQSDQNLLAYARDIDEAFLLSRLKPRTGGSRKFLFEIHEILHVLHREQPGKHDWKKTFERERRILNAVDGLIVINPQLADSVKEHFGYSGPIAVEPNGFNPNVLRPVPLFEPGHEWPGADDDFTVLYIGKFHQGKGVEEAVQSLAFLPERFKLRIVGSGNNSSMEHLRELARGIRGGENRVAFTGHVQQKDLYRQCLGTHLAMLPQQESTQYFSPLKLTEYLALGLPLVSTPLRLLGGIGGMLHMAGDFSPQGLAAAVLEVAGNEAKARNMRRDGLAFAEKMTWDERCSRILSFAESI